MQKRMCVNLCFRKSLPLWCPAGGAGDCGRASRYGPWKATSLGFFEGQEEARGLGVVQENPVPLQSPDGPVKKPATGGAGNSAAQRVLPRGPGFHPKPSRKALTQPVNDGLWRSWVENQHPCGFVSGEEDEGESRVLMLEGPSEIQAFLLYKIDIFEELADRFLLEMKLKFCLGSN